MLPILPQHPLPPKKENLAPLLAIRVYNLTLSIAICHPC